MGSAHSGTDPRVVRVVPDVPAIHRRFDYSVPEALDASITVGSRVRIQLAGRRVGGWVVEDGVAPPEGVTVKPLAGSSGAGPPPSVVALSEWASWRWAGPLSSFLGTGSPDRVVAAVGQGTGEPTRSGPAGSIPQGAPVPASPGGGSVALIDQALAAPFGPIVVRLAPALDSGLLVLELLHRVGVDGTLVLVPSHARARQMADRLARAGVPTALLPAGWGAASSGTRTVVGTRSAAWAPIPRVRAVVVLDAHDEAYREERAPTWSAVDVAVERGRRDMAPVLLVSPCPPLTMVEGTTTLVTPRPVERRGWPLVEVVDRKEDDPRTGLFSERLVGAVRAALDRPSGRVVCILNRTGRIRLLTCATCGALARCTRCGAAVSQNAPSSGLACRMCGHERPALCAECDSSRLKSRRVGVTRATEELAAVVGVEAVEVSGSSAPAADPWSPLVMGTEAALHRIVEADLVAFLDIDQHLLAPRFGAGEEALALLARAARVVGPRRGRVLVQTRLAGHEALLAATSADPPLLTVGERAVRIELGLPPFGALALLRGPGAAEFGAGVRRLGTVDVSALEPERWMVHAADHVALCDALAAVARPPARLRIEVDPSDT